MINKYLANSALSKEPLYHGLKVEVILQPSTSDVHLEPCFPQWPMSRDIFHIVEGEPPLPVGTQLANRITLLPNPATFVLGDLIWGGTPTDAIFHLNSEEASKVPSGEKRADKFGALAGHLLGQRSYYPLYPAFQPAAEGASPAAPLEVTQLWHLGMPCSPDILLLPSKLGVPCCKISGGGTVVINPGYLARNKTYAKVTLYPASALPQDSADDESNFSHTVSAMAPSRVRVDIDKILLDEEA